MFDRWLDSIGIDRCVPAAFPKEIHDSPGESYVLYGLCNFEINLHS